MRLDQSAIRTCLGSAMLVVGTGLEVLGWYGVSGESVPARQLPYLASASIPGAAVIVGGVILLAVRPLGDGDPETARRIADLHALLVEEVTPEDATVAPPGHFALPSGTVFHTGDCALIAGKPEAEPVSDSHIVERKLAPCPVCDPRSDGRASDGV